MGSFTNKITAEFTPPKTWKLEEDLGFREGTLTKEQVKLARERIRLKKIEIELVYEELNAAFRKMKISKKWQSELVENQQSVMEKLDLEIGNFAEGGTPHSFVIG